MAPFILKIFKMAISVDTVYKTVLLILNKEQRGYMTPDEFNRIGTQVQRELFEKCFEDLNQQVRVPQTDMDYADRVAATDEKIAEFKTESDQSVAEKAIGVTTSPNTFTVPSELYKLGSVTYEPNIHVYPEMQRLGRSEFYNIRKAPLVAPTKDFPVYLYEDNKCIIYPSDIISANDIKMQYVKKPNDVRWGYYSGKLGQYVFDTNKYVASGFPVTKNFVVENYLFESLQTNFTASGSSATYLSLDQDDARITYLSEDGGAGTGSGLVFNLELSADGIISELTVVSPGKNYLIGDVFNFSDTLQTVPGGVDAQLIVTDSSLYSGTTFGHTDFGLQTSEQTELVLNILLYAGIVIRDPQIIQIAQSELQQDKQNEKS